MKWLMAALCLVIFLLAAYGAGDSLANNDLVPAVLLWCLSAFCVFMAWLYAQIGVQS